MCRSIITKAKVLFLYLTTFDVSVNLHGIRVIEKYMFSHNYLQINTVTAMKTCANIIAMCRIVNQQVLKLKVVSLFACVFVCFFLFFILFVY